MRAASNGIGIAEFRFDEPLDVNDILEFHAARIMLLIKLCGQGKTPVIKGRTKLAKLDFFVRYPHFLESGLNALRNEGKVAPLYSAGDEGTEAGMVRYRYGPWDHRYYNLLAMLAARELIKIGVSHQGVETYALTKKGDSTVSLFMEEAAFNPVVERCRIVGAAFGQQRGTELKEFIYRVFETEVTTVARGEVINESKLQAGH